MRIGTKELQDMLGCLSKVRPNATLEITNYVELHFTKDRLILNATDGNNFISAYRNIENEEELSIIVKTDQFTKLVGRTTTDYIDITPHKDYISIKGNGTYKMEILQDEEYPKSPIYLETAVTAKDCWTHLLQHGINVGKNIKSVTAADGVLFGYLLRDGKIVTGDSTKIAVSDFECEGLELLIPPVLATLISSVKSEKCDIFVDSNNMLLLRGKGIDVSGQLMEGVEEYPNVIPIIETQQPSTCKVGTQELSKALDRIGLFVSTYDMNLISVGFSDGAIILENSTKSYETIEVTDQHNHADKVYDININLLKDVIAVIDSPTIEIGYGEDDILKITTDEEVMMLATTGEEE